MLRLRTFVKMTTTTVKSYNTNSDSNGKQLILFWQYKKLTKSIVSLFQFV